MTACFPDIFIGCGRDQRIRGRRAIVPLRLKLLKDLALRVVSNRSGLDEAPQVELFRSEHGHLGRWMGWRRGWKALRGGERKRLEVIDDCRRFTGMRAPQIFAAIRGCMNRAG